eukprot:g3690.t1
MRPSASSAKRVVATGSNLLKRLLSGDKEVPYVLFRHRFDYSGSCDFASDFSGKYTLFPGSFNPLHFGHRQLMNSAAGYLGENHSLFFEIAALHPDKGYVDEQEIVRRLHQFYSTGDGNDDGEKAEAEDTPCSVIVSRASLYSDKAKTFPSSTILIGADTMARILNPKYYEGNSMGSVVAMLEQIRSFDVAFLVAGRASQESGKEGVFLTGNDILEACVGQAEDRKRISDLAVFQSMSEEDFRADVSSTELRRELRKCAGSGGSKPHL